MVVLTQTIGFTTLRGRNRPADHYGASTYGARLLRSTDCAKRAPPSDKTLIQGPTRMHPRATDPIATALTSLARRHQHLTIEIVELESMLARLVTDANPGLIASTGIGTMSAAPLLLTAGDNA